MNGCDRDGGGAGVEMDAGFAHRPRFRYRFRFGFRLGFRFSFRSRFTK